MGMVRGALVILALIAGTTVMSLLFTTLFAIITGQSVTGALRGFIDFPRDAWWLLTQQATLREWEDHGVLHLTTTMALSQQGWTVHDYWAAHRYLHDWNPAANTISQPVIAAFTPYADRLSTKDRLSTEQITLWYLACGTLAPLAILAGIPREEAAAMSQAGDLTREGLEALTALLT